MRRQLNYIIMEEYQQT